MVRRQLFDRESSTYTYLVGDETSGLAAIIDPVISNVGDYLAILEALGLRLDLSIDTHTHADHITAHNSTTAFSAC